MGRIHPHIKLKRLEYLPELTNSLCSILQLFLVAFCLLLNVFFLNDKNLKIELVFQIGHGFCHIKRRLFHFIGFRFVPTLHKLFDKEWSHRTPFFDWRLTVSWLSFFGKKLENWDLFNNFDVDFSTVKQLFSSACRVRNCFRFSQSSLWNSFRFHTKLQLWCDIFSFDSFCEKISKNIGAFKSFRDRTSLFISLSRIPKETNWNLWAS